MIPKIIVIQNYQQKAIKRLFFKYKNLLERPFIVYADFESSLIPTTGVVTNDMDKANSACCHFVCTFDSSRNKLYEFIGQSCVIELLNTLTQNLLMNALKK